MLYFKAILIAISTYSSLPTPKTAWKEEAMRLSIAFLPVVGVFIGLAVWLWELVCRYFDISPILFAALAVALPILISGGIHLDGYCDTVDALASHRDRERRLEILKDPNAGAFALIYLGLYLLVNFALFFELYERNISGLAIGLVYIISRACGAYSAILVPNARKEGMLVAFTEDIDRKKALAIISIWILLAGAGLLAKELLPGIIALILCLILGLYYGSMAKKTFGGATGDTTGFYIQITELLLLAGLFVGLLAGGVWG